MLNYIWPVLIIISIVVSIFNGNIDKVSNAILSSPVNAIKLAVSLIGIMCMWNGIINIIIKSNLIKKITKVLNPIIKYLFPDIKEDDEIFKEISLNIVSNLIGLGYAATPLGLKALENMDKRNKDKEILSDSMMMLIVLNTASIQIIPTTILSIRNSLNSNKVNFVIIPIWISSIIAAICGIIVTKILIKRKIK